MDLDRYVESSFRDVAWCLDQLEREDISKVLRSCALAGEERARDAIVAWKSDIRELFATDTAERDHILRPMTDETERHLFLLAATYMARCGWALLERSASKGVSAEYHPRSDFLMLQAAEAAIQLADGFPSLWPFDHYPDPFS